MREGVWWGEGVGGQEVACPQFADLTHSDIGGTAEKKADRIGDDARREAVVSREGDRSVLPVPMTRGFKSAERGRTCADTGVGTPFNGRLYWTRARADVVGDWISFGKNIGLVTGTGFMAVGGLTVSYSCHGDSTPRCLNSFILTMPGARPDSITDVRIRSVTLHPTLSSRLRIMSISVDRMSRSEWSDVGVALDTGSNPVLPGPNREKTTLPKREDRERGEEEDKEGRR